MSAFAGTYRPDWRGFPLVSSVWLPGPGSRDPFGSCRFPSLPNLEGIIWVFDEVRDGSRVPNRGGVPIRTAWRRRSGRAQWWTGPSFRKESRRRRSEIRTPGGEGTRRTAQWTGRGPRGPGFSRGSRPAPRVASPLSQHPVWVRNERSGRPTTWRGRCGPPPGMGKLRWSPCSTPGREAWPFSGRSPTHRARTPLQSPSSPGNPSRSAMTIRKSRRSNRRRCLRLTGSKTPSGSCGACRWIRTPSWWCVSSSPPSSPCTFAWSTSSRMRTARSRSWSGGCGTSAVRSRCCSVSLTANVRTCPTWRTT